MDAQAIPLLQKQAARFLNWDLNTRVMAPFSNFYSACNSNGSQLTDCIVWDSQIARPCRAPAAAKTFDISDMSGGCGNAHFYANTTGTYSYDANTPDPSVLSSCEHYGLHDGTGGKDMTTPYTNKMTDDLATAQQTGPCTAGSPYCSTEDDCGGHGTVVPLSELPELRHGGEERRRHPHAQLVGVSVLLGRRTLRSRADARAHSMLLLAARLGLRALCRAGGACSHGMRGDDAATDAGRRRSRGAAVPRPAVLPHDRLPPRFDPGRDRRPDRARRDGRLRRRGDRGSGRVHRRRTSRASGSSCS